MINQILQTHPTRKNRYILKCANPECDKTLEKHIFSIQSAHEEAAFCCSRKCKNCRFILDHHNKLKIKLYGYDNPFNNKEIQQRCQQSNPFKTKEGQQKCREGMIKTYGVASPQQDPEIKKKTRQTIIAKYGSVTNYHKHVKEKTYVTQCQKYGTWFFGSAAGDMTVESLKQKWGHTDEQIKIIKQKKAFNNASRSQKAQKCINMILEEIGQEIAKGALHGENEYALFESNKMFKYDLTIGKKIIEFNGDYWHANPKHYNEKEMIRGGNHPVEAKYIWEKDRKKIEHAKNNGYYIYVIWESDFDSDPVRCIKNAANFILGKQYEQNN